jgi:hypothetical protein
MTVRRFLPAALFALVVLSSLPAAAEPSAGPLVNQDEARRPGEIAREGIDTLLRAFDQFVAAIPQYALPELNGRGDIIIRRKNPPPPASHAPHSDQVVDL